MLFWVCETIVIIAYCSCYNITYNHETIIYMQLYLQHISKTILISKKIFRSGGMAPSEWTRSVRAVRDTPVADYSAPGVNTTRPIVYHPPIAVSLSLRVLSVSYFERSLWRCGQLWQYVGMGSLGTRLHRDCNAMCDTANISPRVPSTSAQNAILFTNYTHHSKSPDLCGYWQSIARSVCRLSY